MLTPFLKIGERSEIAKKDSDAAYFLDLLYSGEQLLKLTTAGLVSCIADDSKRHRYSLEYNLIRADSVGEWSKAIEEVLTGTSAQYFNPVVSHLQRELTERVSKSSWQYDATSHLNECLRKLDSNVESLPNKVAGKTWFQLFASLRNKTRGHGAIPTQYYSSLCTNLCESIDLITRNYSLFNDVQWAYLHRNLSGKYRVSDISSSAQRFHNLKSDKTKNFENGVHIFLTAPTKIELIVSNPDLTDFFFPNGGFNNKRYEVLSYISGGLEYQEATKFLNPPGELPSSETEGRGNLDLCGNVFTNLPKIQHVYIKRNQLEDELKKVLADDRHPIITLTGRGGIGKTSLAISVLSDLCISNEHNFSTIIWFSARDIDLLSEGAKPVKAHVLSEEDVSKEYVKLVEPSESAEKGFKAKSFFEKELTKSSIGPVLFIFDNFETVKNPIDLFQWLDTFIRMPNKILITTRFREFKADYPIEVGGMNEAEFEELVNLSAKTLDISEMVKSPVFREELYEVSDGHPYVVKVLLGEVAKEGKIGKIKRIFASKDEILIALFERTFNGLTPVAKRVFLTLSNWKSTIPQIAIEAVLLREENETMDVEKAIEELHRSSLIDITTSAKDGMLFISTPLSASLFGKKKLHVSPMKTAIEADTKLLHTFGVGLNTEIDLGVEPRIIKFFRDTAKRVSYGTDKLENNIPILELICRRYPKSWLTLASLYEEEGYFTKSIEALKQYLEIIEDEFEKHRIWNKLTQLYKKEDDWNGEVHSLSEICELSISTLDQVSSCVYRINMLLSHSKSPKDQEKTIFVKKLIKSFTKKIDENVPGGSDYSELAWLYLHLNEKANAIKAVKKGLKLEPKNYHCLKLKKTLNF